MKVLPYDSFTILTDDPLPIVLQRLNALVEPTKTFRFSTKHAPYQGSISESGFQISRIIHYDNSFLPVIRGRFEVESDQTVIHVQMNTHPFVMAFLGFWFLCWYSGYQSSAAHYERAIVLITGRYESLLSRLAPENC